MGVSEQLEILYLPSNFADNIQVLDFLPVKNLDGDLVPGELVLTD